MTSTATRVLFDEPGPRGRARIRLFTVLALLLLAGLVALALYQFARSGQLGRSRWLPFTQLPYLQFLAQGFVGTITATVLAAIVSFPLGVVLALGRLSTVRPVRWLSTGYIELFRSIPLLLLIYAFLLALPRFGINLPILWKLVVPIILVNVAVLAEVYRAGILSVDRGQFEAAAALGLPNGVAMRAVILPQAIRYVIPALVTQLVALLKDSTLGYVVSYPELMKQATNLTSYTHLLVQTYLVVAAIYVVVNLLLSRFAEWLERRLGRRVRTRVATVDEAVGTEAPAPWSERVPLGGRGPVAPRLLDHDLPVESQRVVDCHVHVFDPQRFPYRSDTFYAPAGQELGTPARLGTVLDAHGVEHALLVGPNSGYGEDNRCLLDTLAAGAGRYRGMAVVENSVTRAELVELRAAGVLGVTLNAALLGVGYYEDAAGLLADLAALDMIADVQVVDDQLVQFSPLLERSGVRVHIDHCGRPDPDAGLDAPGFRELLRWGRSGRAVVKLSGCVKVSHAPYPHRDLLPYVRALVDAFGPDRCVWGSDWPFLRMPERVDYGPLLTLLAEQVPDTDARRRILWDTPVREFGLGDRH